MKFLNLSLKNTINYYLIDDIVKDDGTRSTVRVEKLGNTQFLTDKYGTENFEDF